MFKASTWFFLFSCVCLTCTLMLVAARNDDIIDVAVDPALSAEQARYVKTAKTLSIKLPELHLNGQEQPLDDAISENAFDIFINELDYDNSYFLQSDIQRFASERRNLDDFVKAGDLSFAKEVFSVFTNRVANRYHYVTNLLSREFDLTIDESYYWKRKDADRPANEKEWDDLWRKKIKNEYILRVLAKEEREKLKAKLEKEAEEKKAAGDDSAEDGDPDAAQKPSDNAAPQEPGSDSADAKAPAEPADAPPAESKDSEGVPENDAVDLASEDEEEMDDELKSPKEAIIARYNQQNIIVSDHDDSWVVEKFLSAFAHAYDPHTDYMSPASEEDFDISMRLSLVGVGALLSPEDGTAKVERIIPGGPADKQGDLTAGDKIVAVAQEGEPPVSILHWPLYKTVRVIRGEIGSKVTLVVIPASDPSGTTKKITIVRDEVKLEEQAAKSEVKVLHNKDGEEDLKVGVIHLPAFYVDIEGKREGKEDYRSSRRDVEKALIDFKKDNVDGVILDLRNNGGGSLLEAIEMTGLFFQVGPVVQVLESSGRSVLPDRNPEITYDGPLIILVNRLSASASEILAAALQDYGRAIIVGDSKTHGKGSVQTVVELNRKDPELGSLKVTTAGFYRIAGGSTQLKGVTPHIVVESAYDTMEVGEEYLDHALAWSQIRPARFYPVGNIARYVPELKERSLARREKDERYLNRRELLKSLQKLRDREEISLNIEKRREFRDREKELQEMQRKLLKENDDPDDNDTDLILLESMHILADYLSLTS
jgi:carboxyl-terminal processing protease